MDTGVVHPHQGQDQSDEWIKLEGPNSDQAYHRVLGTDCDAPATSHFGRFVGERGRRRRWHARVPHRDEHHGFSDSPCRWRAIVTPPTSEAVARGKMQAETLSQPMSSEYLSRPLTVHSRSICRPKVRRSRVVAAAGRSRGLGSTYLNGDLDSGGA